ncbi:3057_t:CDS:2, partial [Funneliformis mosseae]
FQFGLENSIRWLAQRLVLASKLLLVYNIAPKTFCAQSKKLRKDGRISFGGGLQAIQDESSVKTEVAAFLKLRSDLLCMEE